MNILISINEQFISIAEDMLYSLKMHHNAFIDVYLIYNEIKEQKLDEFSQFIEKEIGKLHLLKFQSEISLPMYINHISIETYYRLYAPYLLPKELDRILYLDADLIIHDNIDSFYNQSFDGNILVGVKNFDLKNKEYNKNLGLPEENTYINAGVLLINLEEYRKQYSVEDINQYISSHYEKLKYQDQDVINGLFYQKIKLESLVYNFQIPNIFGYFYEPKIVHYTKSPKPWSLEYNNPNKAKYLYDILKERDSEREKKLREAHQENHQNKTIILSIIVPVYNVIDYLEKCIKNLSVQGIEDIEIICIDDGSTDGSSEKLDEYAKKDYRIKVIHQENAGLSAARNRGLEIAKGKYIGFIDSDDYPAPEMYEELIQYLEENELDIAVCNFYNVFDTENVLDKDITENRIIEGKNEILKETLRDKIIKNFVWSKVYKKELWDGVIFPVGKNYEDIAVSIYLAEKANKIGYYTKPLYYYLHRQNSITKSKDFHKIEDVIGNTYERYQYISKKYPNLKEENDFYLFLRIAIEYIENTILSKEDFINHFKEIIKEAKENIGKINRLKYDKEDQEKVNYLLEELNNYNQLLS